MQCENITDALKQIEMRSMELNGIDVHSRQELTIDGLLKLKDALEGSQYHNSVDWNLWRHEFNRRMGL